MYSILTIFFHEMPSINITHYSIRKLDFVDQFIILVEYPNEPLSTDRADTLRVLKDIVKVLGVE